jgi:hypothetical protein
MSKKAHLKLNGVTQLTNNLGDTNFDSELLQNKYIKEGWRTAQQLLELGLLQDGKEKRTVIDRESKNIPVAIGFVNEDMPSFEDEAAFITYCESIEAEFVKIEEGGTFIYSYNTKQLDHDEWFVEKNYTIEVEDTSAQELAEANAKAQRKADIAEIKGFLQDIQDSDLKPWHKKILKFLVKEQKE